MNDNPLLKDNKYLEWQSYISAMGYDSYTLLVPKSTSNNPATLGFGTIATSEALNHLSVINSDKSRRESRDFTPLDIKKMDCPFDLLCRQQTAFRKIWT